MPNSIKYDSELVLNKLIEVIRESGLSYGEIARRTGIPKSSIHRYATKQTKKIPIEAVRLIANATGVSTSYIMGWEDKDENIYKYKNVIPLPKTSKIPLLGEIACGEPIFANENIECDVDLPENIRADFALKCKGDSMIDAHIYNGDIVYIRQQATVNDGEIAAVLIENEATLKRFYKSGDTVTLMPCNTKCQPFVYSGAELENIRILGKAVGFTSTKI